MIWIFFSGVAFGLFVALVISFIDYVFIGRHERRKK